MDGRGRGTNGEAPQKKQRKEEATPAVADDALLPAGNSQDSAASETPTIKLSNSPRRVDPGVPSYVSPSDEGDESDSQDEYKRPLSVSNKMRLYRYFLDFNDAEKDPGIPPMADITDEEWQDTTIAKQLICRVLFKGYDLTSSLIATFNRWINDENFDTFGDLLNEFNAVVESFEFTGEEQDAFLTHCTGVALQQIRNLIEEDNDNFGPITAILEFIKNKISTAYFLQTVLDLVFEYQRENDNCVSLQFFLRAVVNVSDYMEIIYSECKGEIHPQDFIDFLQRLESSRAKFAAHSGDLNLLNTIILEGAKLVAGFKVAGVPLFAITAEALTALSAPRSRIAVPASPPPLSLREELPAVPAASSHSSSSVASRVPSYTYSCALTSPHSVSVGALMAETHSAAASSGAALPPSQQVEVARSGSLSPRTRGSE